MISMIIDVYGTNFGIPKNVRSRLIFQIDEEYKKYDAYKNIMKNIKKQSF